jgi:hypothetical protein
MNLIEGICKEIMAVVDDGVLRRRLKNIGGWFFCGINVVDSDRENI